MFVVVVQLASHVWLFATPWTVARQDSPFFTTSRSLLKLVFIELVMPSNHLILCHPCLLPTIFPSIWIFSNELALPTRWPKYWSFSTSPSNEYLGLISFRMDRFDLLAVQGTLQSLLQHHSSKASILWHSTFLMVPLSNPHTWLLENPWKWKVTQSCPTLCDPLDCSPVVMYRCESWTIKKAECQRIDAFKLQCWRRLLRVPWTARRSNQSILEEISPEYWKHGFWPSDAKSWHIWKDPNAGKDWGQEEKETTEDEMAGWHHWLDGCESEWTPGVGDGQGGLACCDSWGCRVGQDWATELNWIANDV